MACSSSDPDVDAASADASSQSQYDGAAPGDKDASSVHDAAMQGGGPLIDQSRTLEAYPDRPYLLHVPNEVAPSAPVPIVLALHGGGSNAEGTRRVTCPSGVLASPDCLDAVADREGFAIVYPSGMGSLGAPNVRTWNAGGGAGDFQCVSGPACRNEVDDLAYFDALLADLAEVIPIDDKRIFALGISNGGAMSHRLACERADRFAAIASVAGGNQFATSASCAPSRPPSVMEIHGTADPCWAFEGGSAACAQDDGKNKVSVDQTMQEWSMRNGCASTPTIEALPDSEDDGTTTQVERYAECDAGADVVLVRVEGGGHTWPGGYRYSMTVGPVAMDFDADALMLEFFQQHPMP